jgi:hypothetical protein
MTRWMERIFDLERLSLSDPDVHIGFAHDLPAWVWALIALGAGFLAWGSYMRLAGARPARWALAGTRTALLVLIVILICQPRLVRQTERVEPDCVIVLTDRSLSMTVRDAEIDGRRVSRDEELAGALRAAAPALRNLARDRAVMHLGFDAGVFDLPLPEEAGMALPPPRGRRTAIGAALEQALRRASARPVAGVVLFSDGRSSDTVSRATLRQLEARGVPVFVYPLGSRSVLPDLTVARIDAPTVAFVGDTVPVEVRIDRLGSDGPPTSARVQLLKRATGLVLGEQPLEVGPDGATAVLTVTPEKAGGEDWIVRVMPEGPDLSPGNNEKALSIEIVDRPIRVVLLDGYPRWEYRYLKNLLVREPSIRSSTLLLASNRRYIQEGTEPLPAIPRTAPEWAAIDVLILGDLHPALFSEDQLRQIRALVAERGSGLMWIGGPSATPNAWRATPLADLLPFALNTEGDRVDAWEGPVVLDPGPAAARYGILRMGEHPNEPWPSVLSSPDVGWSMLHYAQRIDPSRVKPTAEVLALARPVRGSFADAMPLLLTMRYGAGRVAYVGTDETWRYRYARGETLPERFWIPLIRLLARESLSRSGHPAILTVAPNLAEEGQPVQISIRLIDQALLEQRADTLTVTAKPLRPDSAGTRAIELTLLPTERNDEGLGGSLYTVTWVPPEAGEYVVESTGAMLVGMDLVAHVEITAPGDELRTPQADHALLDELALETNGKRLARDDLEQLSELLPNRELRLVGTPEIETLWDKWPTWVVIMLLTTLEWAGRRLIKLA